MMKKTFFLTLAAIAILLTGCNNNDDVVGVTAVTLDETSITLTEGETQTLVATVTPTNATIKTVTWTSSDAEVATVDQTGKVTAVEAGTATITAASGGKQATCLVTVEEPEVPVTSVTLNVEALTLLVGATQTLVATILPPGASDQSVSWESSAPAVATVNSDGLVTAVSVGSATITATSSNGLSDGCIVTVQAPVVPVASVTLDEEAITLFEGATQTLVATILPSDASNQSVSWESSAPAVATVSADGLVTALSEGTAIITATSSNGLSDECIVTVEAVIEVTDITLDVETLTLPVGDTYLFAVTITPVEATNTTVIWASSNTDIVSIDANGVATAVAVGTSTISATSLNGISDTCVVTVEAAAIR